MSRAEIRAYYQEGIEDISEEDRREYEDSTTVLRLMHLIEDEADLLDRFASFRGDVIAGLFYFEEKRLVVVSEDGQLGLGEESVLAHEYVHSMQSPFREDEHWLALSEDDESEHAVALSCVLEVDATLKQVIYMVQTYGRDYDEMIAAEQAELGEPNEGADSEPELSEAMQRYFSFDYNECVLFALAVFQEGGFAAIDKLYAAPPSTTEQILNPEEYFAAEGPTDLAKMDLSESLGDGWEAGDISRYGEFERVLIPIVVPT